jgi:hypothetical protein
VSKKMGGAERCREVWDGAAEVGGGGIEIRRRASQIICIANDVLQNKGSIRFSITSLPFPPTYHSHSTI